MAEDKKKDDTTLTPEEKEAAEATAKAEREKGDPSGKKLADATPEELQQMVKDLRSESADRRTKAKDALAALETLKTSSTKTADRLKALEDANLTDEERRKADAKTEADRVTALEEQAGRVDGLTKIEDHIKAELESEMAVVEKIEDEKVKKAYTDLLSTLAEDDHLGRLQSIKSLHAIVGSREDMKPGDNRNPGEPGGGDSQKGLAASLAWSSQGTEEARMAGLIPRPQ